MHTHYSHLASDYKYLYMYANGYMQPISLFYNNQEIRSLHCKNIM